MITLPDGRALFFEPDDAAEVQLAILSVLTSARREILLKMYALCWVPAVDALLAARARGVDVRLVLDRSQSGQQSEPVWPPPSAWIALATGAEETNLGGSTEIAQVLRLQNAAMPMVIGDSAKGNIIHAKYVVVDAGLVLWGSHNWSLSAFSQVNQVATELDPAAVAAFRQDFRADWNRLGGTPPLTAKEEPHG